MIWYKVRRPLFGATSLVMLCVLPAVGGCDLLQSEPPEPVELSLEGIDVTSTSSGDLLIQSGEEVHLDAFVTNRSTSAIDSVVFRLERGSFEYVSYHTFIDGERVFESDFATLRPGQSLRHSVTIRIPPNTPAGTVEALSFVVSGARGRSGSVSGEIATVPLSYQPAVVGTRVDQDTDGDGQAEPGETARIVVEVGADPGNTPDVCFTYGITTSFAQATVLTPGGGPVYGGGCVSSASPVISLYFSFRSASFLSSGTVVPFTLTVQDRHGNTWDLPVRVTLA